MRSLRQGVGEYVAMKKAMGFLFHRQSIKLRNFCVFMDKNKQEYITIELAKQWALGGKPSPTRVSASHLAILRAFAIYWNTIEPKTEIWPESYWRIPYVRKNPYIYQEEEIQNLLRGCNALEPDGCLGPLAFYTLFGLIASCGLRVSEATCLLKIDVDLQAGVVTIRSKFNKIRTIPVDKTTLFALQEYAATRETYCKKKGNDPSPSFFITTEAVPINVWTAEWAFNEIALKCGVRTISRRGPRIHDLRHTFVVRTLESWYRQGKDVEALLPILSTYVGHANPGSTFWYITITPELMALASDRMDRYMGGLPQ